MVIAIFLILAYRKKAELLSVGAYPQGFLFPRSLIKRENCRTTASDTSSISAIAASSSQKRKKRSRLFRALRGVFGADFRTSISIRYVLLLYGSYAEKNPLLLIPVMPDVLDVVVLGSFMRKESSKIPLKISSFLSLRRFKVAFSPVWYVTTLSVILRITELFLRVNP